MPNTEDTQRCNKCHVDRPLSMFGKSPTCRKGIRGKCKRCDGSREYSRNYNLLHPAVRTKTGLKAKCINMLSNCRRRSVERGLECDLTLDFLMAIFPKVCPVFGVELDLHNSSGIKGRNPWGPSLDRFNNNEGYTQNNVRIISWRANALKSNATVEELEAIVTYMKEYNIGK